MGADRDPVVVPMRPRPRTDRRPAPDTEAEVYAFGGADPVPVPRAAAAPRWEQRAVDALAFVRKRLAGAYEIDQYGFDADLVESIALPALRVLYDKWFRVEVNGLDNVPSTGAALLVANSAGGLGPWDLAMTAVAVRTEHPAQRFLRMLAAEFAFRAPGIGTLARRTGATLACASDAERLLRAGELVGSWPERLRGTGKRFRDRYQVQRFRTPSFVAAAATGAPIVPVSIVGAEESVPVLGDVPPLARLLNLPYFPITPTFPWLGAFGLVPLPTKWYLEFGAPIRTSGCDPRDPAAVAELADAVRDSIQTTLHRLLGQRRSIWR